MPQSLTRITVHLIFSTKKRASFLSERESSQWAKQRANSLLDFHWQSGYSAFSVSQSHVHALVEYIRDQEEHHRREGFQDELRRILEKNNLEWDERYLWD